MRGGGGGGCSLELLCKNEGARVDAILSVSKAQSRWWSAGVAKREKVCVCVCEGRGEEGLVID